MIVTAALAGPAPAQEAARVWPSQQSGMPEGEDAAMGASGSCRLDGERIAQEETACLDVHGERFPALCGKSLNNTSWIRQDGSC